MQSTRDPNLAPNPQPEDPSKAGGRRGFMWQGGFASPIVNPSIKLVDDGRTLSVKLRGMRLWVVGIIGSVPLLAFIAYFLYEGIAKGRYPWSMSPALVLGPLAVGTLVMFVHYANAEVERVIAVLDRAARTLELRDYGLVLHASAMKELVLVRGFQVHQTSKSVSMRSVSELTIVAQPAAADGTASETMRWHVTTAYGREVERLADTISRECGVPVSKHDA
jgi:hypothetical protein